MDALSLVILTVLSVFSVIYLALKLKNDWQKYILIMIGAVVVCSTILGLFADVAYLNGVVLRVGYASISIGQICAWITTVILPVGSLVYVADKAQGRKSEVLVGLIGICTIMIFVVILFDLTSKQIR